MNYLMLDTETTNSLDDPLCYDIGFLVINEQGKVLYQDSYVIADIFLDKHLMESAYFADKIPTYNKEIKEGKRKLRRLKTVRFIIHDIMKQFEIDTVIAHNCRFDYRSTNCTQRYLTSSKYRYFFPYGTKFCDTLKMARQVFGNNDDYKEFCYENGFLTERGLTRYTAEILYRYLTNDPNFCESHTGLEDCLIEKDILLACLAEMPIDGGCLW